MLVAVVQVVDEDTSGNIIDHWTVYQELEIGACLAGEALDCAGNCFDLSYGSENTWLGDGLCDCTPASGDDSGSCPDGQTSSWGIDFNCAEWNYDYGDCGRGNNSGNDNKKPAKIREIFMGGERDTYWVTLGNTTNNSWDVDGTYEGCFDVTATDTFGQSSAQDDGECVDVCENGRW